MNKIDYNPDILTCLASLSNDEVFTPPKIVNEMFDLLPKKLWSDKTGFVRVYPNFDTSCLGT